MNQFLRGALTMACLVAALFFVRFYRERRERLFLWFAAAFSLFAVTTVCQALGGVVSAHAYVSRFLSFALIALAVIAKNRQG